MMRSRLFAGLLLLQAPLFLGGCTPDDPVDAYGTFEADETRVMALEGGPLLRFAVEEGRTLAAGAVVGLVDTTQLALQRRELRANLTAVRARSRGVLSELDVLREERRSLVVEQERLENLRAQEAAPQQQLDQINGQIRVVDERMTAVRTRNAATLSEVEAIEARLAQLNDRLARCRVVNPVSGTVLTTFVEPYEFVAPGTPLYTVAALDTLVLRAYVSGAQLAHVPLGGRVQVRIDEDADAYRTLDGTVSWLADEAEFTPAFILTREERVNLVYAVKVRVSNPEGALKIGMPGEVLLPQTTSPDAEADAH